MTRLQEALAGLELAVRDVPLHLAPRIPSAPPTPAAPPAAEPSADPSADAEPSHAAPPAAEADIQMLPPEQPPLPPQPQPLADQRQKGRHR